MKIKFTTKTQNNDSEKPDKVVKAVGDINAKNNKIKSSRFKESLTKFWQKVVKLVKTRKFLIICGILLLVAISFFAGVKVGPYLDGTANNGKSTKLNNIIDELKPKVSITPRQSNTTNSVFNGKITSVNNSQVEVLDKNGASKKFDFTNKSVLISLDGKAIKNSDLKVGYTVIVYSTKGDNETLSLVRLKILAVN